ncbi:MAG: HAD family hydrolase [Deltaproteobacteria bacterium]|nr:HAD family hydrolase [Deltaproteobacteria bacterium]MBW1963144.1 HAD family hydrolase [Deltaproteobacteria bacterium]MBW2154472.1 HAD family hydrolase [Deltaproteobacteria bacterium]
MIKAVVFDFGQTLVDAADGFRAAEKKLQLCIFSDLKLSDWEEFISLYRNIRRSFHEKSNFSRKAIISVVYRCFGRKVDPRKISRWQEDYWQKVAEETREFPEAREVLKLLSANYNLAMITNTQGGRESESHRAYRFPDLMRFFETIVVAGEGDIPPKPDPAPFRLCLDRLNIEASEAVYVGDDWRIDICGAENSGMHPVWIKHRSVRRSWPEVESSVPVIESLDQLPELPLFD